MDVARDDQELLVVTENGFGKRTPVNEYRKTAAAPRASRRSSSPSARRARRRAGGAPAPGARVHLQAAWSSAPASRGIRQPRPRRPGRAAHERARGRPRQRRRARGRVRGRPRRPSSRTAPTGRARTARCGRAPADAGRRAAATARPGSTGGRARAEPRTQRRRRAEGSATGRSPSCGASERRLDAVPSPRDGRYSGLTRERRWSVVESVLAGPWRWPAARSDRLDRQRNPTPGHPRAGRRAGPATRGAATCANGRSPPAVPARTATHRTDRLAFAVIGVSAATAGRQPRGHDAVRAGRRGRLRVRPPRAGTAARPPGSSARRRG